MMQRYLFLGIIIMFLFTVSVYADGATYFDLTRVGTSARMLRLGGVEGFSEQANGVFENPAGLYRISRFSFSAFATTLMQESEYKNIAASMRLPIGVIGVGYMSLGVDGIPYTKQIEHVSYANKLNVRDTARGSFAYSNRLLKLGYSVSQSDFLHFGVAGSYYLTELDTVKGQGVNFDVGMVINSDVLEASIVMKNMISSMEVSYTDSGTYENDSLSSEGRSERLPFHTIYSLKYRWSSLQFYGQLKTMGEKSRFVKSMGVNFNPSFLSFFHLSGAYKQDLIEAQRVDDEVEKDVIESGFVFGVGLDLFGVSFDYAFEKSDHYEYKSKHYFSLDLSF